jgi:hypothetical protein
MDIWIKIRSLFESRGTQDAARSLDTVGKASQSAANTSQQAARSIESVGKAAQSTGNSALVGSEGMSKMSQAGSEAAHALYGLQNASQGSAEGIFVAVRAARAFLATLGLAALNPIILAIGALLVPFMLLQKHIAKNREETAKLKQESAALAEETRKLSEARFDRLLSQYDDLIAKEEAAYGIAAKLARLNEEKKDARTRIVLTQLEISEKQALAKLSPDDKEGRQFVSLGYQQKRAEVEYTREQERAQTEAQQKGYELLEAENLQRDSSKKMTEIDNRLSDRVKRRATLVALRSRRENDFENLKHVMADTSWKPVLTEKETQQRAQFRALQDELPQLQKDIADELPKLDAEIDSLRKKVVSMDMELQQRAGRVEEARAGKELADINLQVPQLNYHNGLQDRQSTQRDAQIQWLQAREKEAAEAIQSAAAQRASAEAEMESATMLPAEGSSYSNSRALEAQKNIQRASEHEAAARAEAGAYSAERESVGSPRSTPAKLLEDIQRIPLPQAAPPPQQPQTTQQSPLPRSSLVSPSFSTTVDDTQALQQALAASQDQTELLQTFVTRIGRELAKQNEILRTHALS